MSAIGTCLLVIGCQSSLLPTPSPSPTPTAPPAGVWTSLTWRQLDRRDPLASFVRVIRTTGGYFAWGEDVATDLGRHTPLWTSSDGRSWTMLPAATLGSTGVVVDVYLFRGQLTALTLGGDENLCDNLSDPQCWLTRAPLRAWTSPEGATWTQRATPMNLVDEPERRDPVTLLSAATSRWIVATNRAGPDVLLAISVDGVTWQTSSPPEQFVGGSATAITAVDDRFIAVGLEGNPPGQASFLAWSDDGLLWRDASGVPAGEYSVELEATGRDGVVAQVSSASTGSWAWWTTSNGDDWTVDPNFGPLGNPGDGGIPFGAVAGDGERMVAYSFDSEKAWQSFDGVEWTELESGGVIPHVLPTPSALTLLPIGVLLRAGAGAWFGEPSP